MTVRASQKHLRRWGATQSVHYAARSLLELPTQAPSMFIESTAAVSSLDTYSVNQFSLDVCQGDENDSAQFDDDINMEKFNDCLDGPPNVIEVST